MPVADARAMQNARCAECALRGILGQIVVAECLRHHEPHPLWRAIIQTEVVETLSPTCVFGENEPWSA